MSRRLELDATRCDGHGLCRVLLPDAITLDEWGYPVVPDTAVPEHALRDVRRAVAACPALALRVTSLP